jgi:hypothetical protein
MSLSVHAHPFKVMRLALQNVLKVVCFYPEIGNEKKKEGGGVCCLAGKWAICLLL